MSPEISVIIASRNRASSLADVLRDLAAQQTGEAFRFEVIVADNGSTDETGVVVVEAMAAYPVMLRYVYEPRRGKAYALNRALAAARGVWAAFTDDDVVLEPTWLSALWSAAQAHQADGVGGPVRPLWLGRRPAWLSDVLVRQLGMVHYGPSLFRVSSTQTPFVGGNCAYRRELFLTYGGFEPDDVAEDTEWFLRMLKAGRALIYQPDAAVRHKIDGNHLTTSALARRFFRQGRGYGVKLQETGPGRTVCRVPWWAIRLYVELHGEALRALAQGERDAARWHWLRREIYRGVMVQCASDWWNQVPVRRQKPRIGNSKFQIPSSKPERQIPTSQLQE